jgi:hypothetical protein
MLPIPDLNESAFSKSDALALGKLNNFLLHLFLFFCNLATFHSITLPNMTCEIVSNIVDLPSNSSYWLNNSDLKRVLKKWAAHVKSKFGAHLHINFSRNNSWETITRCPTIFFPKYNIWTLDPKIKFPWQNNGSSGFKVKVFDFGTKTLLDSLIVYHELFLEKFMHKFQLFQIKWNSILIIWDLVHHKRNYSLRGESDFNERIKTNRILLEMLWRSKQKIFLPFSGNQCHIFLSVF